MGLIMKSKIDKVKAKKKVEETASKTVKITVEMVKLSFILILFYTIVVSIWFFLDEGVEGFLKNVATISVAGFWAFFLGYFGWRMGESVEQYFIQIRKKK
jgi:Trk-type K+ transport system membrane component